ncbi:hypothetical protein F511_18325, partial [Dorcoceras hygrometricum]
APRHDRDQQDEDAPLPPSPPQLKPYERAILVMLARITRILERQSERSEKSTRRTWLSSSASRDPRSLEHCDVLSMQMDSDLVIYRTTLVRTFQVVTICRVDKSEVLIVLISPHDYVIETLHDRRLTLTRLPTHLGSLGGGIGTRSVLGIWVYLVTLAMSLFDLQDIRQSGPRPDPRLLRQTALEVLTRSARSDSPRKVGGKQISGDNGAAAAAAQGGGGGGRERGIHSDY